MKKNNSMSNFYNDFEQKKLEAESWFNDLRNQICLNFESIEKDSVKDSNKKPANFENRKTRPSCEPEMSRNLGMRFRRIARVVFAPEAW